MMPGFLPLAASLPASVLAPAPPGSASVGSGGCLDATGCDADSPGSACATLDATAAWSAAGSGLRAWRANDRRSPIGQDGSPLLDNPGKCSSGSFVAGVAASVKDGSGGVGSTCAWPGWVESGSEGSTVEGGDPAAVAGPLDGRLLRRRGAVPAKRARQQGWRNHRRGQASSGRRRRGSPGRSSVARSVSGSMVATRTEGSSPGAVVGGE